MLSCSIMALKTRSEDEIHDFVVSHVCSPIKEERCLTLMVPNVLWTTTPSGWGWSASVQANRVQIILPHNYSHLINFHVWPKETITPSRLPRAIKMAVFPTPRLFCLCKINVYTLTNSQQHFDFQSPRSPPPFKSAICS